MLIALSAGLCRPWSRRLFSRNSAVSVLASTRPPPRSIASSRAIARSTSPSRRTVISNAAGRAALLHHRSSGAFAGAMRSSSQFGTPSRVQRRWPRRSDYVFGRHRGVARAHRLCSGCVTKSTVPVGHGRKVGQIPAKVPPRRLRRGLEPGFPREARRSRLQCGRPRG